MIDDMNRLEWIEKHKPDMWRTRWKGKHAIWVVYTDLGKRYEGPTLAEAIDKARADTASKRQPDIDVAFGLLGQYPELERADKAREAT
jgi:hypothetical protein